MNTTIFFFLYNLSHKSQIFDKVVIFFAVYFPYIVIIMAGIFLLFHHEVFSAEKPFAVFMQKKLEILSVFFTGILAWILDFLLKIFFHFPRPYDLFSQVHPLFSETDYAFPSGHAAFFMALAISIFYYHKKIGNIFIFFALLIGIARIISGVHFPVDILGGFSLGIIVAYFINKVSSYI